MRWDECEWRWFSFALNVIYGICVINIIVWFFLRVAYYSEKKIISSLAETLMSKWPNLDNASQKCWLIHGIYGWFDDLHTSSEYLFLKKKIGLYAYPHADAAIRCTVSAHGYITIVLLVFVCKLLLVCAYAIHTIDVYLPSLRLKSFHKQIGRVNLIPFLIASKDFQMKAGLPGWWAASTISTTNRYNLLIRRFKLERNGELMETNLKLSPTHTDTKFCWEEEKNLLTP